MTNDSLFLCKNNNDFYLKKCMFRASFTYYEIRKFTIKYSEIQIRMCQQVRYYCCCAIRIDT